MQEESDMTNEYTHLTPEELCERLNDCWARTQRGNIRVRHAGHGHYYQNGTGYTFHARRRELEESLRRFQERFDREEAERPAKEAAAREAARRHALHEAAPDMLAALKVALEWIDGDIPEDGSWGRVEMIRDAIAKAEGRVS